MTQTHARHAISMVCVLAFAAFATGCSVIERFKGITGDESTSSPAENTPRILTFAEAPSFDLGIVSLGTTRYFRVSVMSQGKGNASLISATLSDPRYAFLGGTFPGDGGTCVQPISGNCSIGILFTAPTAIGDAGLHAASLSLVYESGDVERSATLNLSATSAPAASLFIAGNSDFGTRNVGNTHEISFTLANAGALYASNLVASGIAAPFSFKGGTYPGTGGTCGNQLAPLATCSISLVYAPTSPGFTTQDLRIDYETQGSPAFTTRQVLGTALNLAQLEFISPVQDPYDFGSSTIGSLGSTASFTLRNSGGQPVTQLSVGGLIAPFSFNGGSYPGTGGNCGSSLAAGATCTVSLRFLPSSTGLHSSSLRADYDDGTGSTLSVSRDIQGIGANVAVLSLSDAPAFDFGVQTTGTTTFRTLTLTNTGGSPATGISSPAPGLPFRYRTNTSYPGNGGNCGNSLGVGASCTLALEFIPTAEGGFNRPLTLNYNNGVTSTQTHRTLIGTGGAVANLVISDGPSFDFGSVAMGYSKEHVFTITNAGSAAATSFTRTALASPLSFTGGTCGNTLGALGSCTLIVRFTPTSTSPLSGQLRLNYNNGASNVNSILPLAGNGATLLKLAAGSEHSCALYSTGRIRCWGSNSAGQLGDGGLSAASHIPSTVSGITTATDIAVGLFHSCALLANQRIQCWGSDSYGQLGNDISFGNASTPVFVALYSDFIQVAAGGNRSCGIRSNGTVHCWGEDSEGGLGNGTPLTNSGTPVQVTGPTSAARIAMGRGHACALRTDGEVRCWGSDSAGQIGNGATLSNANTSANIPYANGAIGISAGGNNSCSIHPGGETRCWGANDQGQLADGNAPTLRASPIVVGNLAGSVEIALGLRHGCSKDASNTLSCWGDDQYGQIGNDASFTNEPVPVPVYGLGNVSSFTTGEFHSCAINASGRVYCWGMNSAGQVGISSPASQAFPVFVDGL
jgi:alpha-tubulin suppressor-like RCC1 family protein